jgi:hypothetical protein
MKTAGSLRPVEKIKTKRFFDSELFQRNITKGSLILNIFKKNHSQMFCELEHFQKPRTGDSLFFGNEDSLISNFTIKQETEVNNKTPTGPTQ